ncbi:hypothetical protein F5Y17DRAFT_424636 [Xylariaceae sp. FL0594]|nr:hypothetical protein F5Y17DRAFT_424636 [Xylariaceae sp. FL0594]
MAPLSPLHRSQSSLKGIANFSTMPPLRTDQRSVAKDRFDRITNFFNTDDPSDRSPYNRSQLIRSTYEYALSEQFQDNLLRAFFQAMTLSLDDDGDINFDELRPKFVGFADYLLDSFFLPLKASTKETPQPTPTYHSPVQEAQGAAQDSVGSLARVAALRGECLLRDRHRCVVSRKFDLLEAEKRCKRDDDNARDDDGNLFAGAPFDSLHCLEVAYILPHSLTNANAKHELLRI